MAAYRPGKVFAEGNLSPEWVLIDIHFAADGVEAYQGFGVHCPCADETRCQRLAPGMKLGFEFVDFTFRSTLPVILTVVTSSTLALTSYAKLLVPQALPVPEPVAGSGAAHQRSCAACQARVEQIARPATPRSASTLAYCQLLNQPIHNRRPLLCFRRIVPGIGGCMQKSLPQSAQSAGVFGTSLVKVAPSNFPIR